MKKLFLITACMYIAFSYIQQTLANSGIEISRTHSDITATAVLFENGLWSPELDSITVMTPLAGSPDASSLWSYTEDGMIQIRNNVPVSRNIEFRWTFDNAVDMRGYDAVVIELEEAPKGWFRGVARFNIDQDDQFDSETHTNKIRMAGGSTHRQFNGERLKGVGALPDFGETVKIKKIYLEGTGELPIVPIRDRNIMDIMPPRTGNTPVRSITNSSQYTGTVQWTPNHTTFQADTEYTATITLTPKPGWTLDGIAANWFRIFNPTGTGTEPTGTGSGTTHAAGSGVITKTFPATIPMVPYPEPTQFVAFTFDDTPSVSTNALMDVIDELNIKVTFFSSGINLERAREGYPTFRPDFKKAVDRIIAGGHEVVNHAWQHERWNATADINVTRADFARNQNLIRAITGQTTRWLRSPYGSHHEATSLLVGGELGLSNLRGHPTNDWNIVNSPSFLVNNILTQTSTDNRLTDGQIYVNHDQPGQTNTMLALSEVAHEFRSRGFGFMTVSELREHRNFTVQPGLNYQNFARDASAPFINIDIQPTTPPAANLVQGNISGSLTVAVSVTQNAVPIYQWYSYSVAGWNAVGGATSATFAVPTNLREGTYYFYSVVSAPGAPSVTSNVIAVTITAN